MLTVFISLLTDFSLSFVPNLLLGNGQGMKDFVACPRFCTSIWDATNKWQKVELVVANWQGKATLLSQSKALSRPEQDRTHEHRGEVSPHPRAI
jgi:hypothetical protein